MELCDTGDVLVDLLSDIENWDCARNNLGKYIHQQDEKQGNNTQALLTIHFFTWPEEDELSEALVCYCFPVVVVFGEYIFLDLFHFVNLASSCLLIPEAALVLVSIPRPVKEHDRAVAIGTEWKIYAQQFFTWFLTLFVQN